ncbi:MAG: DUF4898 domain-containing protein [Saccharolobus sp.]
MPVLHTNSEDIEEFIVAVARSRGIFNFKSYNLNIITDYQKFFNLILPKQLSEIFIILPSEKDDITKKIKEDLYKIRPSASVIIMYSNKISNNNLMIGYSTITKSVDPTETLDKLKRNFSKLLKLQEQGTHPNLYYLYTTFLGHV